MSADIKALTQLHGWTLFVGANENSEEGVNKTDGELFNAAREGIR